jgi:nucleoside-diphosphate-sugar epimerase
LGEAGGGGDDRFLISLGTLSLLVEASERQPLLCLVDDAHLLDEASADAMFFAAALEAPSGVYNVVEDVPATRAEHARILSALTRVDVRLLPRTLEHLPLLRTLARSHRVSNLRFRQVAGWRPSYPDPQSGWERILATVGAPS